MAENKNLQSLKRAFTVIEAMSLNSENSVSRLAEDTGLNKTTVHRILNSLVDMGYVSKDPVAQKYSLSLKFLMISSKQLAEYDIHKKMHPLLEKIAFESGETVHLVERQGEKVIYIDKCESNRNSVRMVSRIGMTLDVFTTAVGKAMLARQCDDEIIRLWKEHPHIKKTDYTVTSLPEFMEEINLVRKNGFALDNEENELGVRCVAVAIPDAYGQYRYAVSISAPKTRFDDRALEKTALLLAQSLK